MKLAASQRKRRQGRVARQLVKVHEHIDRLELPLELRVRLRSAIKDAMICLEQNHAISKNPDFTGEAYVKKT